jgi:hypothetical protein
MVFLGIGFHCSKQPGRSGGIEPQGRFERGAFAFLKSGEIDRPMPAAGKAGMVATNDAFFRRGQGAIYPNSIDLLSAQFQAK